MTQTPIPFQWKAHEFKHRNINRSFYLWSGLFLLATILYALVTNSPIMAITFILIGIMGFITLEQPPAIFHYAIIQDGIIVEREIYTFENIESFWIVYEEDNQYISLKTTGRLTPFVHIPLGDENPSTVREILLRYAKEEKQDPSFIDTIEKMLHIG